MKTLYLDLRMGAAGDMLTAALLELLPEPDKMLEKLNSVGLRKVVFKKEAVKKCGIKGTGISVKINGMEESEDHVYRHGHDHTHDHEHSHEHSQDHEHDHGHHHEHGYGHPHEHGYGHDHGHDHDGVHAHDLHEHEHKHDHEHSHSSLHDIEHIVCGHLSLSDRVKKDVMAVYTLIAEAESRAHGVGMSDIHFHEVGTMDAIADITAVCMIMEELSPDEVIASPVHVGCGHVRCAHGILPVPAPATAYILKDVPVYGGKVEGELCTPTGAALIRHFVKRFGDMPVMRVSSVGYGMGKKDFEAANCVRAMIGEAEDGGDSIFELSFNVDDMTGEKIGFAMERLFEAGALDVYTVPVGMKKSRPGTLIKAMCHESEKDAVIRAVFRHTTTIGIREQKMRRYILERETDTVCTQYGDVRRKTVRGYGVKRSKPEYEDLAGLAEKHGVSIADIERCVHDAACPSGDRAR